MTKLYHNGEREGWQVPGKQDKKAERLDVPNAPDELAAWLNHRRVGPTGAAAEQDRADEQLSSGTADSGDYVLGKPIKDPPHVAPRFLGDVERGAEFVPVAKAAEIDRLLQRCPKCHGSRTARVLDWIPTASIDELQRVAEQIKEHVTALREGIEEGTRQ